MFIKLTGKAFRQDKGMLQRMRYELKSAPSRQWLDLFLHVVEMKVTGYPREMFEFDGASVTCPHNEMRAGEILETLALYLEDANAQFERMARSGGGVRAERERIEAKRRQTSIIVNELFEDEDTAPS